MKRVCILSIFILGSTCSQCSLSYKGDQLLWGQLGRGWLIVKSQMSMTNADLHADCLSALFYLVTYFSEMLSFASGEQINEGNKEDVILLPIQGKKKKKG